jgi:dinuclear metal center YbgI/SA1388 family protein
MVRLGNICEYISELLNERDIKDPSINGLQFYGKNKIDKIALGVNASIAFIEKAVQLEADFLLVHHGIFWSYQSPGPVDIIRRRYYELLIVNNLSLYATHLPLDIHPQYGNNAGIFKLIKVKSSVKFPENQEQELGLMTDQLKNCGLKELLTLLQEKLNLSDFRVFPFKEKDVILTDSRVPYFSPVDYHQLEGRTGRLAVVSGAGADGLNFITENKIDTYITGEVPQHCIIQAEEMNINFILAGHYNTETQGVQLLGKHLEEKFDIETVFIDLPTGL